MQQKTFFNELEASTQEPRASLERTEVIRRCLDGQVELQTYQAFLTEAYHHVKHTVPLLMACGARLPDRLDWLRGAIVHYVEEEYGHQEWILNDLQNCGIDKDLIRHGNPQFATEMIRENSSGDAEELSKRPQESASIDGQEIDILDPSAFALGKRQSANLILQLLGDDETNVHQHKDGSILVTYSSPPENSPYPARTFYSPQTALQWA